METGARYYLRLGINILRHQTGDALIYRTTDRDLGGELAQNAYALVGISLPPSNRKTWDMGDNEFDTYVRKSVFRAGLHIHERRLFDPGLFFDKRLVWLT